VTARDEDGFDDGDFGTAPRARGTGGAFADGLPGLERCFGAGAGVIATAVTPAAGDKDMLAPESTCGEGVT
jgi:hypothetical protein